MAKQLKNNPEKLLITILIGNNVVNILSASIATAIALNHFGKAGIAIATFFDKAFSISRNGRLRFSTQCWHGLIAKSHWPHPCVLHEIQTF
jgi:CBS domain containing-hemolysin-like protein